jgi:hypothetical protein
MKVRCSNYKSCDNTPCSHYKIHENMGIECEETLPCIIGFYKCISVKPIKKFNYKKAIKEIEKFRMDVIDTMEHCEWKLGIRNGLKIAIEIINKNVEEIENKE